MEVIVAGLGLTAAVGWLAYRTLALRRGIRGRVEAFETLTEALTERHAHTLDLVRLASGYLMVDGPLLETVALSRYYAMQARTVLARTRTETDLSWALARLMLAAQSQSELSGHPRFKALARAIVAAEDRAAAARERFNDRTRALARAAGSPLGRVLARGLAAGPLDPFDLDPTVAREAMMTLLKPRPTLEPGGAEGAPVAVSDATQRPVPSVASVAFGT